MGNNRIDIRMPKGLKRVWQEYVDKKKITLTELVLPLVNDHLLNDTELGKIDREILQERQRESDQKKILYLLKRGTSEAFLVGRTMQHMKKILDKDYLDEHYAINNLEMQCKLFHKCKEPEKLFKNYLPFFIREKWHVGIKIIKRELYKLGVSKEEISSITGLNRNSIGFNKQFNKGDKDGTDR